ncbi:NAD-dependent protein deacetylase Sirt6 [Lucilia sericata]|uniref:NAD-dependent protein deacetylase Sirt6 n=1 Tax=Lucilia sericata TaxID=13632 RepID=UPI0018A81C1D|nr:NAD-dependent protein deacetylase Sirt6 [Lucilia sericata]
MSCNYADGLSPYENKGVLGIAEKFDAEAEVEEKVAKLVELLQSAKHVVVHTGAGISTTAGIPDFRGPKGVWTLEEKGEKPNLNISFNDAVPTITHMALRSLIAKGYVQYIVSQNIDGLHLKSGLPRRCLSELHGNIFIEQCNKCRRQFVRSSASETVGQKLCGGPCRRECRGGMLLDNVLDWEHDLPERDLDLALMHSTLADLNITLGTTLQIIPSGNIPLKNKKHGGKLVICNLQPTKHDKKADLVINTYVDDILTKVCKRLGIEVPPYDPLEDPTKTPNDHNQEWTIQPQHVKEVEKQYNAKLKAAAAQRKAGKNPFNFFTKKEPTITKKKRKTEEESEIKIELKKEIKTEKKTTKVAAVARNKTTATSTSATTDEEDAASSP